MGSNHHLIVINTVSYINRRHFFCCSCVFAIGDSVKPGLLIKGSCFCQLWTKTGVCFRAEPWRTYTEHQSGRCILYRVGDHCRSWLPALSLSSSKHPAGSERWSPVLEAGVLSRRNQRKVFIWNHGWRLKKQEAWSLRFLKCKYPMVGDSFFLDDLLKSV